VPMRTHTTVTVPAPPVVLEAPESVAMLVYSTHAVGDTGLFAVLTRGLDAAADVASAVLGEHYAAPTVTQHLQVAEDPTFPRPHVHLAVRERVEPRGFEGLARYAHARYQAELQTRLYDGGIGITRNYPSAHGWEITAAIPQLGKVARMRCGTGRVLYPLELETAPAPRRAAG
jgi:hypothetical protein